MIDLYYNCIFQWYQHINIILKNIHEIMKCIENKLLVSQSHVSLLKKEFVFASVCSASWANAVNKYMCCMLNNRSGCGSHHQESSRDITLQGRWPVHCWCGSHSGPGGCHLTGIQLSCFCNYCYSASPPAKICPCSMRYIILALFASSEYCLRVNYHQNEVKTEAGIEFPYFSTIRLALSVSF